MYQNIYEEASQVLSHDLDGPTALDPLGETSVRISDLIEDVAHDSQKGKLASNVKQLLGKSLKAQT